SSPDGIDCGATCSSSYVDGTRVSLSATPAPGSVFDGWNGDCSGTGACQVTLESARAVSAAFSPLKAASITRAVVGQGPGGVPLTIANPNNAAAHADLKLTRHGAQIAHARFTVPASASVRVILTLVTRARTY